MKGMTGFEAFQIMLVGFKITHLIDWSWWAVLAPTWIMAIIGVVAIIIIAIHEGTK